jgi:hypothetical protein
MYNPPDVRWDVLNDIMSQHYLHIQRIFGLKGLGILVDERSAVQHQLHSAKLYEIRSGGKECPCRDLTLQLNIRLRNFSTSCLLPERENGTRVVRTEILSKMLSMLNGKKKKKKKNPP